MPGEIHNQFACWCGADHSIVIQRLSVTIADDRRPAPEQDRMMDEQGFPPPLAPAPQPEPLRAALEALRGMSYDLADAVLDGRQPEDIGNADWAAANETYRAALQASPPTAQPESRAVELLRDTLIEIYDSARMFGHLADGSGGPGVCRYCGAPPPDYRHDHDVACPAAKAAYALEQIRSFLKESGAVPASGEGAE